MVDHPVPELIDVRPDERFAPDRLTEWIRGRVPGSDRPLTVLQFARGKANLTFLLRFGDGDEALEYVLRRPPLGPVAPGSHDMSREYRVLSTLWQAFPYAARAYAFCDDEAVIGAPFFVMERKHGVVVQGTVPPEFGSGADAVANRSLSEVVVDTLAEFHAVDPEAAGLGDLGRPEGFLRRQVEGWIERWHRAKHEENRVADEIAEWLSERIPDSGAVSLLHNDWRLDNMAVAEDDPGRCVAVYDWDMATRGDPLADLGTVMAVWYDAGEMPASLNPMPTVAPGFMTRDEAIERYAERSGRDLSQVDWYVVFGTFKLAVVIQQIYIRWLRGQTKDERFAVMGEGARRLFQLAAERRS
ncbi:MAG: phosphotransferase family protein [Acidimicrobiia bacterium]|jgi:aminoglycoside phosphotransferase (APT) family kinase protein